MELRYYGLIVVSLLYILSPSLACNCLVNHPQTKYCFSDFVVQGRVVEKKKIEHPDKSRPINYRFLLGYRVELLTVYKGRDYMGDADEVWIHTPDAGGLCGLSGLRNNKVYLLSGRYTRDIYYSTYCDMWSEWDKLTENQLVGMTTTYNDNCKCRIRGVIGIVNVNTHSKDYTDMAYLDKSPLWDDESCRYNPVASVYYKSHDCETMYSHCIWANETCLWEPSTDYRLCYQAREAVWRHRNTIKGLAANVRKPRQRCKISATRFIKRCARVKAKRDQKKLLAAAEGVRAPANHLEVLLNEYARKTMETALMK